MCAARVVAPILLQQESLALQQDTVLVPAQLEAPFEGVFCDCIGAHLGGPSGRPWTLFLGSWGPPEARAGLHFLVKAMFTSPGLFALPGSGRLPLPA